MAAHPMAPTPINAAGHITTKDKIRPLSDWASIWITVHNLSTKISWTNVTSSDILPTKTPVGTRSKNSISFSNIDLYKFFLRSLIKRGLAKNLSCMLIAIQTTCAQLNPINL